jgi:hypothetical protein
MGYTVFYGGHNPKKQSDRASWNACGTDYQVTTNVEKTSRGFRRRRRYWCASPISSKIGWKADGTGGQACAGLGSVSGVGGGEAGFSGRDVHFPGKFAGYKCTVPTPRKCVEMKTSGSGMFKRRYCKKYENVPMGPQIKTWSGDSKMTTAGANDNNRKFKSLYDQIVFGIETQFGRSTGFCADAKNLSTVVHKDGRTCYQMLKGAGQQALADTKTATYCATAEGRKDEKCKCYNVAGSGFLNRCKANPTWAGCKEIMPRINELQKLLKGSNLKEDDFGNADCIVPDICGGAGVYIPSGGKPNCAKKMEVCNQVMNQDNVKAYGDLKAIQSCNFTGANSLENVQKKRDAEKAAAAKKALDAKKAADAKRKRDADAAAKRKRDAAAKKKRDADAAAKRKRDAAAKKKKTPAPAPAPASKKAPATSRTPSGSPAPATASAAAPATGGGLAKPGGMPQNTKIAIGVGGGVVVLCCCLLLMMMMMGGGGGGRRRR